METRANYVTIGVFTLLVIAMGFGFIYWLKRFDEAGTRTELRLEFEGTVSGLAIGGIVYFNGIKVGVVSNLEIDPEDPTKIIVTTSIAQSTPVKTDTRAEVNFNFLTGVAYVDLFGGSADDPNILAGPGEPPRAASRTFGPISDGRGGFVALNATAGETFSHSTDGIDWYRPEPRLPFLGLGLEGGPASGMIFANPWPLIVGDEVLFSDDRGGSWTSRGVGPVGSKVDFTDARQGIPVWPSG